MRILLVWLLAFSSLASAAPLTRRRAMELALAQNPRIAAARADVAVAEARKRQADALRLPTISLTAALGPTLKAALTANSGVQSRETTTDIGWSDLTAFVSADLQIVQPLYTFGKIGHRREAGEHGIRAEQAQAEMTRADVAREVASLYEGLLYARDAARVFEEVDRTLEQSIGQAARRLERKDPGTTEEDLLRLQTARSLARLQLNRARAAAAEATAGLAAYLALPESEVVPEEDMLAPIRYPLADAQPLVDTALVARPELIALREGAAARRGLAAAEHAGYYPDFFVAGLVSAAYTPGRDYVDTRYYADPFKHFYPEVLLGVRWTLQGDMAGRRADEERAQALHLDEQRKWALSAIPAETRRAFEEARRAERDLGESDTAATRAKQWLVRSSASYDMGMGDSRSLADAATGYVLVRTGQIEARYRWNLALADLAQATGTLAAGDGPYPGRAERGK